MLGPGSRQRERSASGEAEGVAAAAAAANSAAQATAAAAAANDAATWISSGHRNVGAHGAAFRRSSTRHISDEAVLDRSAHLQRMSLNLEIAPPLTPPLTPPQTPQGTLCSANAEEVSIQQAHSNTAESRPSFVQGGLSSEGWRHEQLLETCHRKAQNRARSGTPKSADSDVSGISGIGCVAL